MEASSRSLGPLIAVCLALTLGGASSCKTTRAASGRQQSRPRTAPDADGDGVPDARDLCPRVPGTPRDRAPRDGCPDRSRGGCIEHGPIVLLDSFNFRARTAELVRDERAVLDALARTLSGNPQIELVELRGHLGPGETDAGLARRRAEAIRAQLTSRGVAKGRLTVRVVKTRCPAPLSFITPRRVDLRILMVKGSRRRHAGPCKDWSRLTRPCARPADKPTAAGAGAPEVEGVE